MVSGAVRADCATCCAPEEPAGDRGSGGTEVPCGTCAPLVGRHSSCAALFTCECAAHSSSSDTPMRECMKKLSSPGERSAPRCGLTSRDRLPGGEPIAAAEGEVSTCPA